MDVASVVSLIAAIGGFLTAGATLYRYRGAARKTDVEALTITVTALSAENMRLRERLKELEADQEQARCRIEALRCQVAHLEQENEKLRAKLKCNETG